MEKIFPRKEEQARKRGALKDSRSRARRSSET